MSNKIKTEAKLFSRLPLPERDEEAFHSAQESHDFRNQKSPNKTREVLSLFATAILPIIGALGTLFVFLVVNFYVGDVDVSIPEGYQSLEIHAYNQKGQDAIFHTPHFQLMPDRYHFEISVNGKSRQHADAAVKFHQSTKVNLQAAQAPASAASAEASVSEEVQPAKARSKRWWQFWKKNDSSN